MSREIRGYRVMVRQSDGDTIHIQNFKMYRNGQLYSAWVPKKKSLTAKNYLKIRLLGIDTPELHYSGPTNPKKTCPGDYLKGPQRPKIPPQEPWGTKAKEWLDQQLGEGAKVIVELDRDVTDKYDRVLGYVWTVKGDWQKGKLLNALSVQQGHAFPYQIFPNLARFRETKEAAKAAMQAPRGVFAAVAQRILSLQAIAKNQEINEPFIYRKAVDAAICQVSPTSLLHRWVGDARTWKYYNPKQYAKIPIPYRVYFESETKAQTAGFEK